MKVPAGAAPYLEAVVSFNREGKTHSASVVGNGRTATTDSMLANFRSKAVTVGTQALNASFQVITPPTMPARLRWDENEANRVMEEFAAELKLISDAMQEHEGF
jgi:hypothetical protein